MAHKLQIKHAVDWGMIGRYTAGGALAAVPAAALVKLVNEFKNERETRKLQYGPSETDENTIVLTLPKPVAPKIAALLGEKRAQKDVDPFTWAGKWLGAGAGAIGTYAIIDALYKQHAKNRLKAEEEQAKQDMLDVMMKPKTAADKEAQSLWNPVVGIPLLLAALGTGGTAYLTKKILDERAEAVNPEVTIPKVKRIVFKSQPATTREELKQASVADAEMMKVAADVEMLQAMTYSMMDLLRGGPMYILNDPGIKTACAAVDLDKLCQIAKEAKSVDELLTKLAQEDFGGPIWDHYSSKITQDPAFRQQVLDTYAKNNPIKGWFAGKLNQYAPDWTKERIMEAAKQKYLASNWSGVDKFIKPIWQGIQTYGKPILTGLASMFSGRTARPLPDANTNPYGPENAPKFGAYVKKGQFNNAKVLGTLANAVIVSKAITTAQEMQQHKQEQEELSHTTPPTPRQVRSKVHNVEIATTDPAAKAYVMKNKKRLVSTLQQLAEEEKI